MKKLDLTNAHRTPVTGPLVRAWQGLLLAHGYGPAGLVNNAGRPDGSAAARTREFTGEFQRRYNTGDGNGNPDWVVGPASWRKGIEG